VGTRMGIVVAVVLAAVMRLVLFRRSIWAARAGGRVSGLRLFSGSLPSAGSLPRRAGSILGICPASPLTAQALWTLSFVLHRLHSSEYRAHGA
jgi:hypothetical protein